MDVQVRLQAALEKIQAAAQCEIGRMLPRRGSSLPPWKHAASESAQAVLISAGAPSSESNADCSRGHPNTSVQSRPVGNRR